MTEERTVLAIDIGYGWTKALRQGGKFILRSVVGPAEEIRFEGNPISDNSRGVTVKVDGNWLFVGKRAERQSASVAQTLHSSRTGTVEQKALFYAAAGNLIKTTEEQVVVITGLPVADYDDRNKDMLRQMLIGEHTIEQDGKWERHFQVSDIYALPQAMGTLYSLVLDRNGQARSKSGGKIASGRVGVIDVGTYTTNFVLADHLRYVEVGSDSITTGTAEMFQRIAKVLKRKHGLDWTLHLGRVDQAVRDKAIEVYGEKISIADVVDEHLADLAATIVAKARSLKGWGSGQDLRAIVLTGGGSYGLAHYLHEVYPHVQVVDDPQFANVTGYLRAGLRRFG